jgi:hypothetical protein
MIKKVQILFIFLVLQSIVSPFCLASNFPNCPNDVPSKENLSIKLNSTDVPDTSGFRGQNTLRHPGFAGWLRFVEPQSWSDYAPGLAESWKIGPAYYTCQYGYFQTANESQFGAENAIEARLGGGSDPVTKQNSNAFNGQTLGDTTFSWHSDMEQQYGSFVQGRNKQPFPNEYAGFAFSMGRYGFAIHASAVKTEGSIDKGLMVALGEKVVKKIEVSNSISSLQALLPQLITHQGILNSLNVKLDAFSKHYLKGEYSPALSHMNSFLNELEAQRGKHVSEQAFQPLKPLADVIVSNTNVLL